MLLEYTGGYLVWTGPGKSSLRKRGPRWSLQDEQTAVAAGWEDSGSRLRKGATKASVTGGNVERREGQAATSGTEVGGRVVGRGEAGELHRGHVRGRLGFSS